MIDWKKIEEIRFHHNLATAQGHTITEDCTGTHDTMFLLSQIDELYELIKKTNETISRLKFPDKTGQ